MVSSETSSPPPEETYEELMQATYRTLCEHGYADLTLRKIAAESDKSRALIHYHYESKDHLIVALLEYLSESFGDRLESRAGDGPIDRLDTLLDWVATGPQLGSQDGRAYHTAIFELRAQAPYNAAIREQLSSNYLRIQETCVEIIRDGIKQGIFRPIAPEITAALILHAIGNARDLDLMHGTDDSLDTVLEALDQYVFSQLYDDSARP